jgi:propanol-preferring alcohol dehydrogenase
MSDIPSFPYDILWEERSLRSVANLTRDDARELLAKLHDLLSDYPEPVEELLRVS